MNKVTGFFYEKTEIHALNEINQKGLTIAHPEIFDDYVKSSAKKDMIWAGIGILFIIYIVVRWLM